LHTPPPQIWLAPQAFPHAPQLAALIEVSTQVLPQTVPLQAAWQAPLEQYWPCGQALPHAPQFAGSLLVTTQAFPHLVLPPPQISAQTPLVHT
jgi:hypothetical protein